MAGKVKSGWLCQCKLSLSIIFFSWILLPHWHILQHFIVVYSLSFQCQIIKSKRSTPTILFDVLLKNEPALMQFTHALIYFFQQRFIYLFIFSIKLEEVRLALNLCSDMLHAQHLQTFFKNEKLANNIKNQP
jgi:hypothetical protein